MAILVISYEDMVRDLRPVVDKIIRFCEIKISDAQVEALMPTFTFKHMKANKDKFQPVSVGWKKGYDFLRKGKVGDHKQLLQPNHHKQFNDMLATDFPTGTPPFLRLLL